MGVSPGDAGSRERGAFPVGAAEGTAPCSPLPITSERFVGITGSSASFPLSNNCRHSSPTEAGSRRYCSYMTCTNAALCVPKTRSEERRVGKGVDLGGRRIIKKKKRQIVGAGCRQDAQAWEEVKNDI